MRKPAETAPGAYRLSAQAAEWYTSHPMRLLKILLLASLTLAAPLRAEEIRIAAAADLRFAMEEIVGQFRKSHPNDSIDVTYGSSGKFHAQIQNGAPFDLFFSADIALPRQLQQAGLGIGEVKPYAIGRIVVWRPGQAGPAPTLAGLAGPDIRRIAIANPKHAPYGMRAIEALKAAGVWATVENKLIFGENIAQTAQFVQTGNADAGIIALSLAITPEYAGKGQYVLIPAELHQPLEQGYLLLKRAENKPAARRLSEFMGSAAARDILVRYGFQLPGGSGRQAP